MSLLELMAAAAIMAIAMTVATAIFVTLVSQKREAERFLDVQGAAMGASSQTQIDLTNAGYRFPAPAFGVHVYNNPTQLSSGGTGATYIDTSTGCGTGGLAAAADAIEVVTGNPMFLAGKVQFIDSAIPTNPGTDHNIVLQSETPFTLADTGAAGVALFYGKNGESCIGEVTLGPGAFGLPPQLNVTMLTREWEPVVSTAYYPNCPRQGMSVFRFMERKRFFLCAEPSLPDGGGLNNALYRQLSNVADGGYIYDPAAVELIQDGVEDFQLAARVTAGPPTALLGSDTDCRAGLGTGPPSCDCNVSSSSACDLTTPGATFDATDPAAHVNSVDLTLTLLGRRAMKGMPTDGRPASLDHAASATPDGKRRLMSSFTYGMPNISQVRP